jgi:aspartate/methionine/tyrosine aminotransferase
MSGVTDVPPVVALRGVDVPPFYAGIIAREAAALRRLGRSVIPMHFGQPSVGTPPRARAAAAAALAEDPTGYVESRELAERIARHYGECYGVTVDAGRVLLTNGASSALVALFAALFSPGDRIGVCRPGYPAYRNALRALGREPVEIDCAAATGFRLEAHQLAAIEPGLHGLVVASPANPTGAMLDRVQLGDIASLCRARGIRLLSDEIYHGISYGDAAVSALEVDPGAIAIGSFSKLYRMPGWRLGWLVAPEPLVARLSAYIANCFLTPPTLSQRAALAAFDDPGDIAAAVASYRANRARLLERLPAIGISGIAPPDGAFYLYADIGHLTDDSLAFCRRLLAETGVATAPGIDFDPEHGRRFLRLSFAVSTAEVEEALARLGPWLAAQPRRA